MDQSSVRAIFQTKKITVITFKYGQTTSNSFTLTYVYSFRYSSYFSHRHTITDGIQDVGQNMYLWFYENRLRSDSYIKVRSKMLKITNKYQN